MKIITYILSITSFLIVLSFNPIHGQNCSKKKFCEKDSWEDYDYQGQSSSGVMAAGDEAKIKIVAYSGNNYKIMICGDPELGQIDFTIIKEIRKYVKEVKEVLSEEVPVYKENDYGAYETDEWGDYIQTGTEMQYDTIWEKKRVIEEELLFNSAKQGENAWYFTCDKTQTLLLKINVSGENQGFRGCVDVMIGRKSQSSGPRFH